jgi:hypothetical protein
MTLGYMMWKEFSCHLIRWCKLFALINKHKTFLLRLAATQRSIHCKPIGGRRADSLRHAGPDQIRNSWPH